ncbi:MULTISPECIES: hypothetical protein [Methanothrix]|uniref:Uncharacterized protein n=1 Tax=Methanothrix soehngenii (strain ATCC 5969 / DSM 3671 / JCM 10134 / NBRC 103675 / OCM 69 / GP-6) TaxID=990316 RepID=F4BZA3_METSG|nr:MULTISPECIES: hypothetical protein [Methanothrix]AEB67802.1 conserved hypothetical protein [Methanothrix soehngenii GP6]
MNKKYLEIGLSTGLVLLMIILILGAQMTLPTEERGSSFAIIILLFIVAMGIVGLKLDDM